MYIHISTNGLYMFTYQKHCIKYNLQIYTKIIYIVVQDFIKTDLPLICQQFLIGSKY